MFESRLSGCRASAFKHYAILSSISEINKQGPLLSMSSPSGEATDMEAIKYQRSVALQWQKHVYRKLWPEDLPFRDSVILSLSSQTTAIHNTNSRT